MYYFAHLYCWKDQFLVSNLVVFAQLFVPLVKLHPIWAAHVHLDDQAVATDQESDEDNQVEHNVGHIEADYDDD